MGRQGCASSDSLHLDWGDQGHHLRCFIRIQGIAEPTLTVSRPHRLPVVLALRWGRHWYTRHQRHRGEWLWTRDRVSIGTCLLPCSETIRALSICPRVIQSHLDSKLWNMVSRAHEWCRPVHWVRETLAHRWPQVETLRGAQVPCEKDKVFRATSDHALEQQPSSEIHDTASFFRRPWTHVVCYRPDSLCHGH